MRGVSRGSAGFWPLESEPLGTDPTQGQPPLEGDEDAYAKEVAEGEEFIDNLVDKLVEELNETDLLVEELVEEVSADSLSIESSVDMALTLIIEEEGSLSVSLGV